MAEMSVPTHHCAGHRGGASLSLSLARALSLALSPSLPLSLPPLSPLSSRSLTTQGTMVAEIAESIDIDPNSLLPGAQVRRRAVCVHVMPCLWFCCPSACVAQGPLVFCLLGPWCIYVLLYSECVRCGGSSRLFFFSLRARLAVREFAYIPLTFSIVSRLFTLSLMARVARVGSIRASSTRSRSGRALPGACVEYWSKIGLGNVYIFLYLSILSSLHGKYSTWR